MALEALAAGLVISVKDRTARGLTSIQKGFQGLKARGGQLKEGLSSLAPVVTQLTAAGVVVGGVLGVAGKKAVDFEKQLSAVRAVSDPMSGSFSDLTKEIKRLGATTAFSATEAAQGAENLTRAGFSTTEVIEGLSGALSAAAADSIPLATSARLVANNVRAFGLEAKQATFVADVLAQTSAKTNTNMIELGEGLKFVAPIAKELGLDIKDTSAALGILADAGLQGSVGGTALKNALLKIAKPSAKGAELIKEYGIETILAADGSLDLVKTMDSLAGKLAGIPSRLERVALAQELFGIRGQAAASNFVSVVDQMGGSLQKRFDQIQTGTEGAAKRMAEIRLDNVAGAFTLLDSAMEGLSIELFSSRLTGLNSTVRQLASSLSFVVELLPQLDDMIVEDTESMAAFRKENEKLADTLTEFAIGISRGMEILDSGFQFFQKTAGNLTKSLGMNGGLAETLGTVLTVGAPLLVLFGAIAAGAALVAVPLIALGGAAVTVLKVLGVGFASLLVGIGLFTAGVQSGRKEGESFGDSLMRTFSDIKSFAMDFFQGFMEGFDTFIKPAFESIVDAGFVLLDSLSPIFDVLGDVFGDFGGEGRTLGETLAAVVGGIAEVFAWLVKHVFAPVVKFFASNVVAGFISGIGDIVGGFMDILTGASSLKDGVIRIFKGIGKTMLNFFLVPIRGVLDLAIQAADKLGLGESELIQKAKQALAVLQFTGGITAAGRVGPTVVKGFGRPDSTALARPSAAAAKAGAVNVNVVAQPGKMDVKVESKTQLDSRTISESTRRQKEEQLQRLGNVNTPFFRQAIRTGNNLTGPQGR